MIEQLRSLNGTPDVVLGDRELLELMLPVIRADLRAVETHVHMVGERLDCPIHVFGGTRDTTNNRMELQAVIEALTALKRPCTVVLHTDSQYVQKGISEWIHGWKARGWKTSTKEPVKNEDLWKALDAAQTMHTIEWRWVRGHNGHPGNERADMLANRGVEVARGR